MLTDAGWAAVGAILMAIVTSTREILLAYIRARYNVHELPGSTVTELANNGRSHEGRAG